MIGTLAMPQAETPIEQPKPKRLLSLVEFRRKYSDREDRYKYEFNNGIVEKSPSDMNPKQLFIVKNLNRRFIQTQAFADGGELIPEVEQMTSAVQLRRPDISYWTANKIKNADESISEFAIEIISPTDNYIKVGEKRREYFRAGMKVLWQIIPEEQSVYVYTSPTQVTICEGGTICSAAPVIPDFEIAAEDIFAK
ncbi:MAG: Uma2 family endonuclease [Phycisphaerae bacterium]|nr:Uma2 family endonuclease [Saprospiraceae bacterium]